MTLTAAVSNATQLLKIVPREYEVFGGLDVDHHSIVATCRSRKIDAVTTLVRRRLSCYTMPIDAKFIEAVPSPRTP